jgi:hypothetical protein
MALCARFAKKKLQRGKVAKLHVVNPATLQPCYPVVFSQLFKGAAHPQRRKCFAPLHLCAFALKAFSEQATCLAGADNDGAVRPLCEENRTLIPQMHADQH